MQSILSEITKFRKNSPLIIDYQNSNRYRVVTSETDGTKTAYYFSSPIYNVRTRKIVDLKFYSKGENFYSIGSNANTTISENVIMENNEGFCSLSVVPNRAKKVSDREVWCGNDSLFPTTNGIAIKSNCQNNQISTFTIEISKPFLEVRANDKYFALMSSRFRPFVSISCIGTTDLNGNIISPAKLTYQKITDRIYTISVTPCSPIGKYVLFEANLYEAKLFQDTTVESQNPKTNNAFGSIGFIGKTKEYGEQWLYSRTDFSKISELNDKKIVRVYLHLPYLNAGIAELTTSRVASRFCSFGSNWENKIAELSSLTDSQITDNYIDLNLATLFTDKQGKLITGEGFILKAKKENSGFSVIATGDNYFTPQILEINYR